MVRDGARRGAARAFEPGLRAGAAARRRQQRSLDAATALDEAARRHPVGNMNLALGPIFD
jgi:hypothetical protein